MKTIADRRADFRQTVESGRTLLVPGAPNALTARLIEDVGFEAAYVTGAGLSNTFLGMPDIGLLTLPEIATHVAAIAAVVDTPLIVDADTGFGNAVNVWHTVRTLERAGAFAIQLEDQTFPKRCGHFEGKSVVAVEEMAAKVRSAVEARADPNLLIMARTDARATEGLDEAIRRARMYRDAGADILFVEAPRSEDEILAIAAQVEGPKILNIVEGGKTPALRLDRAAELGFAIVLYANLPLVVHIHAVRELLSFMKAHGHAEGGPERASFSERQNLVRKDFFDQLGAPVRDLTLSAWIQKPLAACLTQGETMRLDPKATALLLMDFQASILSTLPTPDDVISKVAEAGAAMRGAGGQVAYVRVGFTPAELDGFPSHSAMGQRMKAVGPAVMADAPSTQVDARIAPEAGDIEVRKRRVGPFSTTDLDARLRSAGVETLVLAGIHTSGCVLTAVRDAFDLDYQVLVLSDGCADPDGATHDFLTGVVFPKQARVMTTAEFVAALAVGAE